MDFQPEKNHREDVNLSTYQKDFYETDLDVVLHSFFVFHH